MKDHYSILIMTVFALSIAGVGAVSTPNSIISYKALHLYNAQSSAFTYNSQIMISVNSLEYKNYEAPNLQNIEFFYSNGTIIPSWLEGNVTNEANSNSLYTSTNTIYWLRIIPANAFLAANTTNTIYMGFAPTSNSLFNAQTTGEAPQLSPSYAEYDNGANVFMNYWNFAGNVLPNGWVNYQPTVTQDNGITMEAPSAPPDWPLGYNTVITNPIIIETDAQELSSGSVTWGILLATGSDPSTINGYTGVGINTAGNEFQYSSSKTATGTASLNRFYVFSLFSTSSNSYFYENYTQIGSEGASYPYITLYDSNDNSFFQWVRTRAYPPNGIMASLIYPIPSITLSNTITSDAIDVVVGSASDNALITATCASGDTCEIENSNGNVLASGTTTITLPYNALPLGYSTLYTNDTTSSVISNTVVIKRVPILTSIDYALTNDQPEGFSANTPVMINFNALQNTAIESNTLNNTVFYFSNGTIAYSWLEGNIIDQQSPSNQLYKTNNVVFWVKTPPSNTFLGPDIGTPTHATIYLGFGSTSNGLIDGNFTGEAPYLSQNYAQYDNGANVFEIYFNGDTPLSDFTVGTGFTISQATGVRIGSDTVNAINIVGSCSFPCFSFAYNKGTPTQPATLDAAVINNYNGVNLASIDLQNWNTSTGANNAEGVQSGWSGSAFALAYKNSGSYSNGNDQQGSVSTVPYYYSLYFSGVSGTSFSGYISPTLYSGGYNGIENINPLSSSNTLYIGDDFGNTGSTPTNSFIEFARVRVPPPNNILPTPTQYTPPEISQLYPISQSITLGQSAVINDNGLVGGLSPYTYQWYVSNVTNPIPTAANAIEANTLLKVGIISGEAQSLSANFITTANTLTGTYYFKLYATDSYPTTLNTTTAKITIPQIQQPNNGGGNPSYSFKLSDNINSDFNSAEPVFTVGSQNYYQNQLPATYTTSSPGISVTFACTVSMANTIYIYTNDVQGLGFNYACGKSTNTYSQELIVDYKNTTSQNTTTTKSTTTTKITTTAQSTATSTTIVQSTTKTTAFATTTTQVVNTTTTSQNTTPQQQINTTNQTSLKIESGSLNNAISATISAISKPTGYVTIFIIIIVIIIFFIIAKRRKKNKDKRR
ncbi:MAG: hypothetical protein ACP5M9_00820 [Candidatus Micrarchaeia archaeon]